VYVPRTVSVTLYVLPLHLFVLGLGLVGNEAPLGIVVKSMSWMLEVSLFTNTIVVPGATVKELGTKFSAVFEPMPAGRWTKTFVPAALLEVAPVVELELDVGVVVLLVDAVLFEVDVEVVGVELDV